VRIRPEHYDHYRNHGYVAVPDFIDSEQIAAARTDIARYTPEPAELEETPRKFAPLLRDPGLLQWDFPFEGETLNRISVDDELLDFTETILEVDDVLLMQSIVWAKYAGTSSFDQELHMDYDENTLVYPRGGAGFDQILMLLYYTDITSDMGPTYVVSWEDGRPNVPDDALWPNYRSREEYPELYAKEQPLLVSAGTLMIMSIRTFHRGSAITATSGLRLTHHLGFCSASNPWMGRYRQWPHFGTEPAMSSFLAGATPRQRTAIGFPAPDHPYWNEATLAGVAARYPGIDLQGYGVFSAV
jgi:ectoine hydroxylase-related dioxygenase (phytanoyl-CoA dioxygenase family)